MDLGAGGPSAPLLSPPVVVGWRKAAYLASQGGFTSHEIATMCSSPLLGAGVSVVLFSPGCGNSHVLDFKELSGSCLHNMAN